MNPDVEFAIDRLLRQRSKAYDRRVVYIPLLSKENLRASEDTLIELQERARTFLGSENEVLLVLGDSNAGKSTFSMRLENDLWSEYEQGGPIPLFIDLKTIDTANKDMIYQYLDNLGFFTNQQMNDMKESRQFILICDGYDLLHEWTNLHTTNRFNKRQQWQAKMIINCRTQYLGPNYRNYFEPDTTIKGNLDFSHTSDIFEEAVIVPFRSTQIEEYIELFTQVPKTEECLSQDPRWSMDQYMECFEMIPHLVELAKNPFMLKVILDVLPTIPKMSRVDLYDRLVQLHFESEYRRLASQQSSGKMGDDILSEIISLKSEDFVRLGVEFSKKLSLRIFTEQGGVNSVTYSPVQDSGSWKDEFFGTGARSRLLIQSSQLICHEESQDVRQVIHHKIRHPSRRTVYRFSHRSILEYFFSCLIFDPRGSSPFLDLAICLDSSESPTTVTINPLGQISIVGEPSIVSFLAERVHQSQEFSVQLQKVLKLSKTNADASQVAANAITILIRAGTQFNTSDLRRIQVPDADLSCGDFDSAQL